MPRPSGIQSVKLTAGLHRQVWVNGTSIFVDVHIINDTDKALKRIELQLEKVVLHYSHAAAGTGERAANHLRLPKRRDNTIVASSVIKKSGEWRGIPAHTSETRTCEILAPRGHVTVSTGRYFEVRYFVNVIVSTALFKSMQVQLPVTIIHMNSLDIMPNALAQVAASIEAKRARTIPLVHDRAICVPYHQGQAFMSAQHESLIRSGHQRNASMSADIATLIHDLESFPRRHKSHAHHHSCASRPLSVMKELDPNRSRTAYSAHGHDKHHASCYHCHIVENELKQEGGMHSDAPKLKLPRLQVSVSGLGFSESEFELRNSPPKKVMLSEQERKMIHQQRELQQQREWDERKRQETATRKGSKPRSRSDAGDLQSGGGRSIDGLFRTGSGGATRVGLKQGRARTASHPIQQTKSKGADGGIAGRKRSHTQPEKPVKEVKFSTEDEPLRQAARPKAHTNARFETFPGHIRGSRSESSGRRSREVQNPGVRRLSEKRALSNFDGDADVGASISAEVKFGVAVADLTTTDMTQDGVSTMSAVAHKNSANANAATA